MQDDFKNAFAARLKQQKQDDRKAERGKLKGLSAPTKGDVQGLPVRLGGTTRDGSLGDFRSAFDTITSLNIKEWQDEEYGIVGVLLLSVVTLVLGFQYAFADAPDLGTNFAGGMEMTRGAEREQMTDKQIMLERCLGDAYSGGEQRMCKMKYGGSLF